jgi:hypothetical protein
MIITTEVIGDIERELSSVDGDTLVGFDCDEVLTTLSEQVWKERSRQFFLEWCGKNIANFSEQVFYDVANFILTSSKNFLVNRKMPKIVDGLHAKGTKAVVVTALSPKPIESVADPTMWRVRTLENFGYDFKSFWEELPDKCFEEFGGEYFPAYSSGVLCCGDIPKGRCLAAFMAYANVHPKKIVFIDDKRENLEDVMDMTRSKGIEFVGVEYFEANKIISKIPFSEKRIAYQLLTLKEKKIWIPDAEADRHITSWPQ